MKLFGTMKHTFSTTLALIIIMSAQAQINFGIKTGLTMSNHQRKDHEDYYEQSTKGKLKFHFGAFAEMEVAENIFAQPGIFLSGRGAQHTSSYNDAVTNFRMTYIDFPLNVVYKHKLPFGKAFAGLGPVVSFATSGKIEQGRKNKKMFDGGDQDFRRGDIGINILAGVEFKNGLLAGLSYNSGFGDIFKHEAARIKNRTFNLSVGYLLQRGK
jgi:hypothetical protein